MNLKIVDKYGREYEKNELPQNIDRLVIKTGEGNFYVSISENGAPLLECDEEFFFSWKGRARVELVIMDKNRPTEDSEFLVFTPLTVQSETQIWDGQIDAREGSSEEKPKKILHHYLW